MKIFFAMLCSAVSFPALLIFKNRKGESERWPKPATPEDLNWDSSRSWFHNMKNYSTEHFRAWFDADAEWWSKFFCFFALVCIILAVLT